MDKRVTGDQRGADVLGDDEGVVAAERAQGLLHPMVCLHQRLVQKLLRFLQIFCFDKNLVF